MTVIEQVSKGCAARRDNIRKTASGGRGNFLKPRSVQIAKQLRPLRIRGAPVLLIDCRINMAIGYKQVEQAIIVEIQEACAPSKERYCWRAQPSLVGHVRKTSVALIAIKRVVVVGKTGDVKIQFAVSVVISNGDPHRGLFPSFAAQRKPGHIAHIFESAVAKVAI